MSYLHALPTIFAIHLGVVVSRGVFISSSVVAVPLVSVVTWMATQSVDSEPLAYISIGVVLMPMWQFSFFLSGWSLANEFNSGTVDHTLVSRTPLPIVMLVKSMAHLAMTIPGALIAFMTVLLISRDLIEVERPFHLVVSMAVAAWSIMAVGYLFAPLFVLVKGRPGFFNALLPLGTALSGFLYPISQLSSEAQIVAHILPTSWAMDGVIRSVREGESAARIVGDWGVAIGLSLAFMAFTFFMFRKVEESLKRSGTVGRF